MLNQFKKARLIEGLTQIQLAEILDVTPGAVSQWEKGLTMPNVQRLKQIATVLHTTVAELLKDPDGKEAS